MKIVSSLALVGALYALAGCGSGGGSSPSVASQSSFISSSSISSSSISSSSASVVDSSSSSSSVTVGLYPSYNINPQAPDSVGMQSNALQMASRMQLGWNIGNTLEATGGETAWGNPLVTNELIQLVKANGFDAIRIPVSWNQYANQQTAAISPVWLDRVKQVVQLCVDNDMLVIVNIHWDGGWLENHVVPEKQVQNNAKQKAFWEQIATHLRDFDERVIFAGANEPNAETAEQMAVLLTYHQTFIDAVRSTGGKNAHRVLVVQGPNTDVEKTNLLWQQMPTDTIADRLMAEVHFYTPFNFALMQQDESWGKQFYYWGEGFHSSTDTEHNPTWGEEEKIDELFGLMKQQFVDQGIPVILGEYAAMRRDNLTGEILTLHLAARAYYLKYVTQQAIANGLIPFYWDSGALNNFGSGIFNRHQNTVFDQQALTAMLEGAGKQ